MNGNTIERTGAAWRHTLGGLPRAVLLAAFIGVFGLAATAQEADAPPPPPFEEPLPPPDALPPPADPDAHVDDGTAAEAPAEAPMEAPAVRARPYARQVQVGRGTVTHLGRWLPETRKEERPDDLWEYYMHGVVDHFATPLPMTDLLTRDEARAQWFDDNAPIDTPYKKSTLPALRLPPRSTLTLPQPLPIPLNEHRGRTLRVFIWVKGDNVGREHDCWDGPPGMDLVFNDWSGNPVAEELSLIKTQGTFPWHCYYRDIRVPTSLNVRGLFVRFVNRHEGTAWFSTLSWEPVTPGNRYVNDEKQDPFSGSLAANPRYDELPYHLRWGRGNAHAWTFFRGRKAGLVGQIHDITTKAGFSQYFAEKAQRDRQHLCHAVRLLADWYHYGEAFGLLPEFEDGWLEHLGRTVAAAQDADTGFWGVDSQPRSLAITAQIVEGLFGGPRLARADRADKPMPWLAAGIGELPRATQIVDTVLALQATTVMADGSTRRTAWPLAAYDFPNADETATRSRQTSLAATANALTLLRMAARHVDEQRQAAIYDAIRDALRHVLDTALTDEALLNVDSAEAGPNTAWFLPRIIGDSSYLERRVTRDLPTPRVSVVETPGGRHRVTWEEPSAAINSVRIYSAPRGTGEQGVTEAHLIGIIQRTGARWSERDPLLVAMHLREASWANWGMPWDYRGPQTHVEWKLSRLRQDLAVSAEAKPLSLSLKSADPREIYVSSVTWYGEESTPALVRIIVDTPPAPPTPPTPAAP